VGHGRLGDVRFLAVTISDGEQQDLQRLKQLFSTFDGLGRRITSPEHLLRPAPGTVLAEDDRQSDPFQVSHAAATALTVAVDHLLALRRMTEDCRVCQPSRMTFQITAHWTLLRAAMEGASRAIWLLGPEDRSERVVRALRLQADNVTNSDAAAALLPSGPRRPKIERIARVKEIAVRAGVSAGDAVTTVRYREIVRYAGDLIAHDAGRFELLWRACSGAAHGDIWAVLNLQDRKTIDSANGVTTAQLTVSVSGLSTVARAATALATAGFGLFDRRDRRPDQHPRP
jgi:hypothetical protein